MSLSFYVAGSSGSGSDLQRYLAVIREAGHTISFDWTVHPSVKPYHDNEALAQNFAAQALEGAATCDVFLLFPSQDGGTTQFTELGIAIAQLVCRTSLWLVHGTRVRSRFSILV